MDHLDTKLVVTDVLPDSRAREAKGIVRGHYPGYGSINWEPVFCHSCGTPYGYVPQETTTFVCWLCDRCSEKYGEQYGVLKSSDEVFWKKCEEIMIEEYGRILSSEEIQLLAQDTGALAKLVREGK
jgi:hypothetical protein